MYFITAASSISHQPTFKNVGFSKTLVALSSESKLLAPNFKDYINPTVIRRMSEILRTSITCALDCLQQAEVEQPDAIIVGTGLGCLFDTEKFLNNFIASPDSLISPTAFIQSTHNTIGGQISILLGNHNYNMTHAQDSLSFEQALLDATLCIDEGNNTVLVGAADEHIEILDNLSEKLNINLHLTSGTSFFVLSKNKTEKAIAKISSVASYSLVKSFAETMNTFSNENNIDLKEIPLVLFSASDNSRKKEIESFFSNSKTIDYLNISGTYFTNSAFALHYAIDVLQNDKSNLKKILICNNLRKHNIGLTLVERSEA